MNMIYKLFFFIFLSYISSYCFGSESEGKGILSSDTVTVIEGEGKNDISKVLDVPVYCQILNMSDESVREYLYQKKTWSKDDKYDF